MLTQLTKAEKKLCRELIEKGVQQEFEAAILNLDKLIENWKSKKADARATYQGLYGKLDKHDKHIARRYDNMSGGRYLHTVGYLLADGLITKDDIAGFSDENKEWLLRFTML